MKNQCLQFTDSQSSLLLGEIGGWTGASIGEWDLHSPAIPLDSASGALEPFNGDGAF